MRVVNLISHSIPSLRLQDTVRGALQLMADFHITHLPVVSDKIYLGLVEENTLLDASDDDIELGKLDAPRISASVLEEEHFTAALRLWKKQRLSVIPVVRKDQELVGVITMDELLLALEEYLGGGAPGGFIVLSMEARNLSVGEIGRIVESNDAHIVHLASYRDSSTGQLLVSVKLDRNDIQDVLATFQRYEYTIDSYFGENPSGDDLRANFAHLMNYLNI